MKAFNPNPGAACVVLLTEAPIDSPLRVSEVSAGHEAGMRLASLGIIPGVILKVIQRDKGGPLLLDVKGTRVALGRGISMKVCVVVSEN